MTLTWRGRKELSVGLNRGRFCGVWGINSKAFLPLVLLAEMTFQSQRSVYAAPGVALPVRDVYLRESSSKLIAVDAAGADLSASPIRIVPGDLVELKLVPTAEFDPTKDITLAKWTGQWKWYETKRFLGVPVGKKEVDQDSTVPKTGRLGSQLTCEILVPGADTFNLAPKLDKQFVGQALRAGTLNIGGKVGDINLAKGEGIPHEGAELKQPPTRLPGVGIENKTIFHLQIFVTRVATKD